MTKTPKDYEVGYARPPKGSRFKPGQSGNPSGRPKGVNKLGTDLLAEFGEVVRVRENGREVELTKQQLVIKALITKAAKGDSNAAFKALELRHKLAPDQTEVTPPEPMSEDEEEILACFSRRLGHPDDR